MFAAIRLFINCRESLVEPEKIVTLFFEIALLKNITNRHVYTHCVNIQETKLNPLLVFDMNEKKNLVNSFVDKYNSLTKDETLFLSLYTENMEKIRLKIIVYKNIGIIEFIFDYPCECQYKECETLRYIIDIIEHNNLSIDNGFMTFYKDRITVENNLHKVKKEKNYTKVLLTIDKKDDVGYQFSSYSDIESLSYYPNQKEALFFPFSVFEVCSIKEIEISREGLYEIKLQFLRRFKKYIESDKNIIETGVTLPDTLSGLALGLSS